jgi:hypothetical protein
MLSVFLLFLIEKVLFFLFLHPVLESNSLLPLYLFGLLIDLASLLSLPFLNCIFFPFGFKSAKGIFEPKLSIFLILPRSLFILDFLDLVLFFLKFGEFRGLSLMFDGLLHFFLQILQFSLLSFKLFPDAILLRLILSLFLLLLLLFDSTSFILTFLPNGLFVVRLLYLTLIG